MFRKCVCMSLAAGIGLSLAFMQTGDASAQDFKSNFEEIAAAAKEEPAVQWCTGMGPDEYEPIVDAFVAAFPDVPRPNAFECAGEEATQRVVAEWTAGAPQTDIVDADTEILDRMEKDNLSLVFDWSIFDGSPVQVEPRNRLYDGRIISVGVALRSIWYNPKIVRPEDAPKSFGECTDPKFKGILAADVRPSFFDMLEEIGGPWSEEEMREWAKGIAANDPLWTRGSAQNFQALSSGERGVTCGQPLHGLFRGDRVDPTSEDAVVRFVIPKEVIAYDYLRLAMAPNPNSPNGTLLFAAWMGSDNGGQVAIAEKNPAYSSPYIEGTFNQRAIAEAGATVLHAPQEKTAAVSAKQNEIILTEWGFPSVR